MSSLYDVWLHLVFGAATKKTERLYDLFGNSKNAYHELQSGNFPNFLTEKNIQRLNSVTIEDAKAQLDICQASGITAVSFYEEDYPPRLKEIKNRPFMLFYKGDINVTHQGFVISVVGTRRPGAYGKNCAEYLSKELSEAGAVIVSGGALGVDSLAHSAALQNGTPTVCVLGCGINTAYLEANRTLREEIMKKGVVLSEYPPNFKPTKYTFADRNRIISGLSDATLVIEAGEKSGALNTAEHTRKQQRKLFAVAGAMFSDSFKGSNNLINSGATAVFSVDDILNGLDIKRSDSQKMTEVKEPSKQFLFEKPTLSLEVSPAATRIYDAFDSQEMSVQTISERLDKMSVSEIMVALCELELNGILTALGGGNYRFNIESR